MKNAGFPRFGFYPVGFKGSVSFLGGVWTPSKLDSLVSWLDVSDSENVSLNGSNISQVTDKSGNSNHLTQADTSRQPALGTSINSLNTADFDGVDDCLKNDGIGTYINENHTMLGVLRKPILSTLISARNVGVDPLNRYYVGRNNATRIVLTLGATPIYDVMDVNDLDPFIFGGERKDNDFRIIANGIAEPYVVAPALGGDFYHFGIGCIYDSTYNDFSQVQLGEFLVFNEQLSDADRQKAEGYLAHKWGLTSRLAADHPYKTTPPKV